MAKVPNPEGPGFAVGADGAQGHFALGVGIRSPAATIL
jgi:hypothetical protein